MTMQNPTADLIRSQGRPLQSPGCWEEYILGGLRWFVKGKEVLKGVPLCPSDLRPLSEKERPS